MMHREEGDIKKVIENHSKWEESELKSNEREEN